MEHVSQNGHKKQKNEQKKEDSFSNSDRSNRDMSKTQHDSENCSNKNGNKPDQNRFPPMDLNTPRMIRFEVDT